MSNHILIIEDDTAIAEVLRLKENPNAFAAAIRG